MKTLSVILSVCILVGGMQSKAETIRLKGTITTELQHTSWQGNPVVSEFEGIRTDKGWKLRVNLDHLQQGSYRELVFDGEHIYDLYQSGSSSGAVSDSVGTIYEGAAPRMAADKIGTVWLALFSDSFFEDSRRGEMAPLSQGGAGLKRADARLDYDREALSASGQALPKRLKLVAKGSIRQVVNTGMLRSGSRVQSSCLKASFSSNESIEFMGREYPSLFRLDTYLPPKHGRQLGDVFVTTTGVLESVTVESATEDLLPPDILGVCKVTDYRAKAVDHWRGDWGTRFDRRIRNLDASPELADVRSE